MWACTLPVVFLLVAPFLGLRAALLAALGLLGVMAIVGWAVCSSGPPRERPRDRPEVERDGPQRVETLWKKVVEGRRRAAGTKS